MLVIWIQIVFTTIKHKTQLPFAVGLTSNLFVCSEVNMVNWQCS